jgi:rubrerythrin
LVATLGLIAVSRRAPRLVGKDAIIGEQDGADVMYPGYARQADQAGDPQAASMFREIAGDQRTWLRAAVLGASDGLVSTASRTVEPHPE